MTDSDFCRASLDVSKRVTMSGNEIANVATECTGLVADATSPPGVPRYLNNGFTYTARCWEFNCPSMYNWLTSGTMTNAKFSVPEIMAYYPSGTGQPQDTAVWNIRFTDKDGVPGNKILEVQRFVREGLHQSVIARSAATRRSISA